MKSTRHWVFKMHPEKPEKVKFFAGLFYSDKNVLGKAIALMKKKYGDIDFTSEEIDFDFTDYYEPEMGKSLKKVFISFKKLIDREKVVEAKIFTNKIEDKFSGKGEKNCRTINIDPGYITLHNVLLPSAKERPHKVYIGKGLFGDIVLMYYNGKFEDSKHTFPDYRTEKVKAIMAQIRELYKKELRNKTNPK